MDTEHGDAPYTHQPGRCGEEGNPILISDRYLIDLMESQDEMILKYGPIGNKLTLKWSCMSIDLSRQSSYTGVHKVPLWYF